MLETDVESQSLSDPGIPTPSAEPSLTRQAASGFAWSGIVSVIGKATAFAGQIVLARFLFPADFGLIALMYGVMTFINLIREAGIFQVLTHRQSEFDRLAGLGIWITGLLGFVACFVLFISAPVIAHALKAPELSGLLYVMAIGLPFDAFALVPTIKLRIDLRFRFLSLQSFAMSLLQMAVTIVMAWKGYGAYSAAWASVTTSVAGCFMMWHASHVRALQKPQFEQWRSLASQAAVAVGAALLYTVVLQTDRFVLQWFRNEATVGIYFFAYNLSVQTVILTSLNLAGVLMPTLGRLNDDRPRQVRAFLRAMRLMMVIGTPICIAQAAFAGPMLRLLFKPDFYAAMWPLRLLSLSMVPRLAGYCAVSLLQAQGRFRTHAVLMAIQVVLGFAAASIGAYFGGAGGVATAAVVINTLIDIPLLILGVSGVERTKRTLCDLFGLPILISLAVFIPIELIIEKEHLFEAQPLLHLLVGGCASVALYWILLVTFAPVLASELRVYALQGIKKVVKSSQKLRN